MYTILITHDLHMITVPEKFNELMSLVKEQKLYVDAIDVLPAGSQGREVMVLLLCQAQNYA